MAGGSVDRGAMNEHNGGMGMQDEQSAMQEAWDRASDLYLARRGDDVQSVSYGNLAPTEADVALLGDVRGKRILDIGCGGGHNAVACALAGAAVTGIDISPVQLLAAQRLADEYGVTVEWRQGDGASSAEWAENAFDLVLALQTLPYIRDAAAVIRGVRQLLRPGGMLVVSLDHPLRNCFYDEETAELSPYPVRAYDDIAPLLWNFAANAPMQTYHQPLGVLISWLVEAGFALQRVIETPAPVDLCDELWPEDSPLAPLRNIPHTVILVARV